MKYKVLGITLCILAIFSVAALPAYAAGDVAVKSNQSILINNTSAEMTAYIIGGSNYVRLRDLAQAIDFDVYYDEFSRTIHILTTVPYTNELSSIGNTPDTAEVTASNLKVFVNGVVNSLEAYSIGGNNYVKLRDVGALAGFSVEWDGVNKRVLIETEKSYSPEIALTPPEPAANMSVDEMRAEIVRLTNAERVKAGLPELEVLSALMDSAQAKAQDFTDNHYFGHISPVYGKSSEMIRSFVKNPKGTGENLKSITAWTGTVQEAFKTWMDSPGHRDNILESRFTHIGIGIVIDAQGNQKWVQHFIAE